MCLRLCARPEADAGDAVSSHDGYAVGGEGPLVCQRAALAHLKRLCSADPFVSVERGVGFLQSLCNFVVFRDRPGREVALDLVDASCVGGTVVVVHGDNHIVAVFLYARKGADLVQTALPCLAEGHAAVKGNRAGVRYRTAARGGVEDLGYGYGAASEETCLLPVRVVFRVEHFYKTFDLGPVCVVVFIEGADVLKNIRHLVDRVVAALRCGAVAGDALDVDADLHTPPLAAVDAAVCGLCGYDEFRADLVLVDNVLPAQAVAVLFLNRSDHHDLASFRDQVQIFHDPCAVYSGNQTAALVGHAAPADLGVVFITFIGIEGPVVDVSDSYSIDMRVIGDDPVSGSHVADDISLGIDNDLVEVELFHLCCNGVDVSFLVAAFTGILYDSAKKCGHVFFVALSGLFDFVQVHSFSLSFYVFCT